MQTQRSASFVSRLLGAAIPLMLAVPATAQITYTFSFDSGSTGWTGSPSFSASSTSSCAGQSVRKNLYSSATTANLISPLMGSSLGGTTTISYDYKCYDWSGGGPTATPWGIFTVAYGATATGPWTTIATIANETQTAGTCLNRVHTFTPPAGALYMRWSATWTAGDYYLAFDNINVSESVAACSGTPTPGNTTGPNAACPGGNFNLGLQNATTGTGVTYQWWVSTTGAGGPFSMVGTGLATLSTSQVVQSWYYCDVTCSAGPSTGSSNVIQVDMSSPVFAQDFGTGVVTPNCWTTAALVGTSVPDYATGSAFGAGSGSARFNFYNINTPGELALTSPAFAPTAPGTLVYFDVAGAAYTGGEIDSIVLEESADGGSTWNPVATMTNEPGLGVLNTIGGTTSSNFAPTASQWTSLSYPLTAGTNRIRFHGVTDYGNNVFLDNISVGVTPSARHTYYGSSCASPAMTMTAAPAPTPGSTTTYTLSNIPLACASPAPVYYFGLLILSLNQDFAGTDLLAGYGIDSPGCRLHVASFDVLLGFVDVVPNQGVAFALPPTLPIGLTYFAQPVAAICPVSPNNAGFVTGTAVRSYVNTF